MDFVAADGIQLVKIFSLGVPLPERLVRVEPFVSVPPCVSGQDDGTLAPPDGDVMIRVMDINVRMDVGTVAVYRVRLPIVPVDWIISPIP